MMMAKFRADHYLIAEFESVKDNMATGEKVLAALKEMPELKDLAIVSRRMEGRNWVEIVGRIDIPAGSRAFWAMVKKELSEREPYHLFVRIDINAEGENIEKARAAAKSWIEAQFVPRIEAHTDVKSIKVLQAKDFQLPKRN
ncbi:MAG: hypothetical protein HXY34_04225 [Candidatus Thorarchaeota archaeon]|nr:hypothetical protein [Candidatus Thorarchaeota archaeon]